MLPVNEYFETQQTRLWSLMQVGKHALRSILEHQLFLIKEIFPMNASTKLQVPSAQIVTLSYTNKLMSDEGIWQNFMSSNRIIHLLRPDYFMIYKFSNATILYQQNVNLDLGDGIVTADKIMKYICHEDQQNIRNVDKVMNLLTQEKHLQPLDYIYKICSNIECSNPSLKRLMRTSILIHSGRNGLPELGLICYHDVSAMISSIRPNTYDISFDPAHEELNHEFDARLKATIPVKPTITPREREIVECLHKGRSSKEIADNLFISKTTVDKHRQNMLRKWQLTNTASLIKKAVEEGWV